MNKSLKVVLLASCLIGFANDVNALTPKRCLEGAVWEYNDSDYPLLVDCAKWEQTNPQITLDEQKAIDEVSESDDYEVIQPEDITPALGKVQNKLNELGSKVFGVILR